MTGGMSTFTSFDVWQGVSAAAVVAVLTVLLRYTSLGRRIKATRSNPDLARTIGIDADRVYVIVFLHRHVLCWCRGDLERAAVDG